jgi:methyl-accepting chemotaxis protein
MAVPRRLDPRNLSVTGKLAVLGGVAVVALAMFGVASLGTLASVRIGSDRYHEISDNNALLADVLPPPEYLVETNLVAYELVAAGSDGAKLDALVAYEHTLREQFDTRLDVWKANTTIDAATRTLITETSAAPALRFFDLLENQLVSTLRASDIDAARSLLSGPMSDAYDEHRLAVDKIVADTTAVAAATEASSKSAAVNGQHLLIAMLLVTLVVMLALCIAIARAISRPLRTWNERLADIVEGGGDLTIRLPEDRADELGKVAASFNQFVSQLAGTVVQIRSNAETLLSEADTLATVSRQVSSSSDRTEDQTAALAATSSGVTASINTVVSATEEIQSAIGEIARSASTAVGVVSTAIAAVDRADETMRLLGTSSAEISDVVKAITGIAEQTNLLALNATIEAARAGEAGKGFGVVANEVKDLARAAAEATGSITSRVTAMQQATQNATLALHEIRRIVGDIADGQHLIAAAVEEQTAVTREIRISVRSAAQSVDTMSEGIHETADRTRDISADAVVTRESASNIAAAAGALRELVGGFRT